MPVSVRYITDGTCVWSWALEPAVRTLMWEFGDDLRFAFVMGGLAREFEPGAGQGRPGAPGFVHKWLEASAESGMPVDPRIWQETPPASSYPSCMAVKAAEEQGEDAARRYLRALREGFMCFRRKLDTREALTEEARRVGLDVERFSIDLASNAIVEKFAADLEIARDAPGEMPEFERGMCSLSADDPRVPFPTMRFEGEGGVRWTCSYQPYDTLRDAAIAAGAQPSGHARPSPLDAIKQLGTLATAEVAAVCELPGPRAAAELWQLATDWKVRPVRALTEWLWEAA